MTSDFMNSSGLLFTSESVTEGHPDKLCDQISDAVVDAAMKEDPLSRVACEVAVKAGVVSLMGEITTTASINFDELVRNLILEIGYDDGKKGLDGNSCGVQVAIMKQSTDIAQGVDQALEYREEKGNEELNTIGAGDQGMMFGYACDETDVLMPLPIELAHRLTRRMAEVRHSNLLPWLWPDGKSQVTVEYNNGKPKRIHTVLISAQHAPEITNDEIRQKLTQDVIMEVLPENLIDNQLTVHINPTGRFVLGGPLADAGLTGRKIIVDTYGGMGRHGGGAFSGKDCTKVDRCAAYAARWVAKNIVAAGLATRCEVQLAYAIGIARPLSINVETFGTGVLPNKSLVQLVDEVFDLRPGAIIQKLDLRRPIYRNTAVYGHFGREDIEAPWEDTGMAEALRNHA